MVEETDGAGTGAGRLDIHEGRERPGAARALQGLQDNGENDTALHLSAFQQVRLLASSRVERVHKGAARCGR